MNFDTLCFWKTVAVLSLGLQKWSLLPFAELPTRKLSARFWSATSRNMERLRDQWYVNSYLPNNFPFLHVHYSDVIMSAMASKITGVSMVCFNRLFVQAQIKENIKAPRHRPLWGEFTGDQWIHRTKGQQRGKCFHLMTSPYFSLMTQALVILWSLLQHVFQELWCLFKYQLFGLPYSHFWRIRDSVSYSQRC